VGKTELRRQSDDDGFDGNDDDDVSDGRDDNDGSDPAGYILLTTCPVMV
jgi:hypothetical protein